MEDFSHFDIETFINIICDKLKLKKMNYTIFQYYNKYHSKYIIDIIGNKENLLYDYILNHNYKNLRFRSILINYVKSRFKRVYNEYTLGEVDIGSYINLNYYKFLRIKIDLPEYIYLDLDLPVWNSFSQTKTVKIKSPGDYNPDITKRSKFGGLTYEQILKSPFTCLLHNTEIESIGSIFERGGLEHRLLLGLENIPARSGGAGSYIIEHVENNARNQRQFPGSYFHVEPQRSWLSETKINDYDFKANEERLDMIFSLALLQQQNWHLNLMDNYGAITNFTFSPLTLAKHINKLPPLYGNNEGPKGFYKEELIIHDKVPIEFCEAIIYHDKNNKIILQQLLKFYGLNIPIYFGTDELYKSLAGEQFIKYIDNYDKLNPIKPNYCYTNNSGDTPYGYNGEDEYNPEEFKEYKHNKMFTNENPYTMTEYKGNIAEEDEYLWNVTLENCGIAGGYSTEKEEELYGKIEDKMEQIYFGDMKRPDVKHYPPFKYIPEFYSKKV